MEPSHGIIGGAASSSPTTGARPGTGSVLNKRKRSGTGLDSSPGTANEQEDDDSEKRKQPGVKRACNECRQQKVSHYLYIYTCDATLRNFQRRKFPIANLQQLSFDAMSSKIPSPLVLDVFD